MNLAQSTLWRKWTGRLGAIFCLLLFLAIMDALVARFREPLNHFSGLPGSETPVSGPLTEKITDISQLTFQAPSPDIRLVFETLQTGYWFGGDLWTGKVMIEPGARPGRYHLFVHSKTNPRKNSASLLEIEVFKDLASSYRESNSLIKRTLSLNPWAVALSFIPFILLSFGAVFYLSHRAEHLLAAQGKAEIYRMTNEENGCLIYFGLGRNQGLEPGGRLTIYDHQGREIGSVFAQEVFEGHSTARLNPDLIVFPGFIVSQS
jgi:hypothetical protein